MQHMNTPTNEKPIPVFIFAGYPKEMMKFIKQNQGLKRRIPHIFDMGDYNDDDLAEITRLNFHAESYDENHHLKERIQEMHKIRNNAGNVGSFRSKVIKNPQGFVL